MPPKMSRNRHSCDNKGAVMDRNNQPRVVLRPLRADPSGHSRYRYATSPPTATLYNQPELSDIRLRVGDDTYYSHKLILCAGSEVFSRMLSPGAKWMESESKELVLQEEDDRVKIFDRFLRYFYTGTIVISETYVIPLFMLADKYNVKQLYDECVKVIENGLKVYVVTNSPKKTAQAQFPVGNSNLLHPINEAAPGLGFNASGTSSSYTDSSDSDSPSGEQHLAPTSATKSASQISNRGLSPSPHLAMHLVASETFSLPLVIKMLSFSHNECITNAALYNLQARLSCQIEKRNYSVWNELERNLIVQMLMDDNFYCQEYLLFQAATAWLKHRPSRQTEKYMADVLSEIRYPILSPQELYEVERDSLLTKSSEAVCLVREAIRFKLFHDCCNSSAGESWSGKQFLLRQVKDF